MQVDEAVSRMFGERDRLLGYIMSLAGDRDLAEDVLQEVAVVVVERIGHGEEVTHFSAWLRGIARNKMHEALRGRRQTPLHLDQAALEDLEARWHDQDAIDDARLRHALRACLNRLGGRARELVNLRYFRGLSGIEVARQLRKPVNTVYVGLSRIHRSLTGCIRRHLAREEMP